MPSAAQDVVRASCEARDWGQLHAPWDLAIGVVTEAAELLDRFRFKDDAECAALLADPAGRAAVEHELALNAERYPVAKARGSNRKYTEL